MAFVVLPVSNLSGETLCKVEVDASTTLDELREVVRRQLEEGPDACLRLMHGSEELSGPKTIGEACLEGSEVTLIRVQVPAVRQLWGPQGWSNEPGDSGPDLEEGELAALITSVEEGTAAGVTRQCLKSSRPYKIHFCAGPDVASATKTIEIELHIIAVLHRKTGSKQHPHPNVHIDAQVSHRFVPGRGYSTFVLFEGGYPHGGECYADVHAPWGRCFTDIPRAGSTIIEIPWDA